MFKICESVFPPPSLLWSENSFWNPHLWNCHWSDSIWQYCKSDLSTCKLDCWHVVFVHTHMTQNVVYSPVTLHFKQRGRANQWIFPPSYCRLLYYKDRRVFSKWLSWKFEEGKLVKTAYLKVMRYYESSSRHIHNLLQWCINPSIPFPFIKIIVFALCKFVGALLKFCQDVVKQMYLFC